VGTQRRALGDRSPPAWLRLLGGIAALGVALPACGTPGVSLPGDQDADVRDEGSATDTTADADRDLSCTFTADEAPDGGTVACRVEPGSLAACTDVAECVMLSGFYCPCIPGICDADTLERRRCADLSRDQVLCIDARVTEDRERACEFDFAAVVTDCIGPAT